MSVHYFLTGEPGVQFEQGTLSTNHYVLVCGTREEASAIGSTDDGRAIIGLKRFFNAFPLDSRAYKGQVKYPLCYYWVIIVFL